MLKATYSKAQTTETPATKSRLQSLDAYRGLIMITLAFNGFGLANTAMNHLTVQAQSFSATSTIAELVNDPMGAATVAMTSSRMRLAYTSTSPWAEVYHQFEHVDWKGCGYWDLIQPSFMFMVGAAMAFSYAKRRQLGDSWLRMFFHAFVRSIILIVLGIILSSNNAVMTDWSLMIVLAQIGLGYTFLFLLWDRPTWLQLAVAAGILAATWCLYEIYPRSGIDFERGAPEVGITKEWTERNLADVPKAWHKNANLGHAVDVWFLNLFPRSTPFRFNAGGYQTINFLPSLATMIFGLMCGELMRSQRSAWHKLLILLLAGAIGLALGYALDVAGICPIVKRIWTPAWTLFSTGWCFLIMASLFTVIDIVGFRAWSYPLIVVGANSIVSYCMSMTLKPWVTAFWKTHLGQNGITLFKFLGLAPVDDQGKLLLTPEVFRLWDFPAFQAWAPLWEPTLRLTCVGLTFWVVCWYLYRNKIFIRI